jgi:hypothetical protein
MRSWLALFLFCVLTPSIPPLAAGLTGTLSQKPALGWNSWNAFGMAIDEGKILAQADLLIKLGLSAVGYNYVNMDDGWMASNRTADGKQQHDPVRWGHSQASAAYLTSLTDSCTSCESVRGSVTNPTRVHSSPIIHTLSGFHRASKHLRTTSMPKVCALASTLTQASTRAAACPAAGRTRPQMRSSMRNGEWTT